jgi:UDPglucose 6-dehydrogenase
VVFRKTSMNKVSIGIIGYGYVGKAFHNFFKGHYDVKIYDPALANSSTKDDINKCDLAVICVPTPENEDGSCNTAIVEQTVQWVNTPLILLKSTVEIGTTDRLIKTYNKDIVFSPEFAGESKYWTPDGFTTDVKQTPFFIFGGKKELCYKLIEIYTPITGPSKTYRVTDPINAELAKYITNTQLAMKVAYCNEIYDLCEKLGTNYYEVRDLWLLDPRTTKSHTAVFTGERGFGGKCFPKDTKALVKLGDKVGVDLAILKSVLDSNEKQLNKNV